MIRDQNMAKCLFWISVHYLCNQILPFAFPRSFPFALLFYSLYHIRTADRLLKIISIHNRKSYAQRLGPKIDVFQVLPCHLLGSFTRVV